MQERRCRASGDRSPDNADPHACRLTPLGVPPQEVTVVRQFSGLYSRIDLRGTGQTLPVAALVWAGNKNGQGGVISTFPQIRAIQRVVAAGHPGLSGMAVPARVTLRDNQAASARH